MVFTKKFYDTGLSETSGGVAEVAEPIQKETPSIASLMAKGGIKTMDNQVAKPVENTEKKEEPKPVEKSEKVETTTTTSEAAKANSESLPPKEEKEEVAPPQKEAVTKPQPSWQEVLKSQQPDTVLKELGFDDKTVKVFQKLKGFDKIDFFSNLIDEWSTKGDLKGYLKELTTDYAKMPPEEVMRHQLQEEYPKASPKALDALYKKKITEAYNLDSEDPEQVEEGKMLLEAEADKYRDTLVDRQKTKLFPEVPEAKAPEPDRQAEQQQQDFEAYKSTINKDPYSEKVFEKKQITIGKGENKFTMSIDPEAIKNILFDTDRWTETQFEKVSNPDGTNKYVPKVENQILTAAFAQNPQKFLDDYAQHYLSIGGKKAIDPLLNAKPPEGVILSNQSPPPKTVAEAMAKSGVRVSGGV
jgi:hypothetical protein